MLKYGVSINRRKDIVYDSDHGTYPKLTTRNCRAGQKATFRTIDEEIEPGDTIEDYGLACTTMPVGPVFNLAMIADKSIEEIFAEWKILSDNLPEPGKMRKGPPVVLGPEWFIDR